jgi:hypothetical protein
LNCNLIVRNLRYELDLPIDFYSAYAFGGDLIPLYFYEELSEGEKDLLLSQMVKWGPRAKNRRGPSRSMISKSKSTYFILILVSLIGAFVFYFLGINRKMDRINLLADTVCLSISNPMITGNSDKPLSSSPAAFTRMDSAAPLTQSE